MASKIVTSVVRIVFLVILFLFLFYPDKLHIRFDYPDYIQSDNWFIRLAKLAFWILLLIEIIRIFYYGIVKSKAKGVLANVATVVIPILVTLIFLEMVFMYVAQSHEGVLSRASQIWWERYWKPVNSLYYRDEEIVKSKTGETEILVVGDSFTAGHGLKDVGERFSNILEQKLGPDKTQVFNLGVSGDDTRKEAKRLQEFPVKPDVIVLQYFPNDIEKVAREKGVELSGAEPYADISGVSASIIRRFYLANFIYWQLPHTSFSTFEKFVQTAYTDTTVLNAHLRDMSRMIAYRDSTKAKMYAVFIPFLFQLDKSAVYTKPVEDYLRKNGVTVVTLTDGIARIPEKERVVGKNDGHASATVNKLIADRLYDAMKEN